MAVYSTIIPHIPPLAPEKLTHREVEGAQAVTSVDGRNLSLSKEKKAFLIEGGRSDSSISKFPELGLAKELASLNAIGLFDCIHSFDQLHLSKFLASQSVRDHKKIAVYIVRLLCQEGEISDIIDIIIKPAFISLVREGIYTTVPEWLDALKNSSNLLEALQEIESSFISKDEMKADYDAIQRALSNTSNQISAESFLNYLKEHPDIREVYGMIGLAHISFLDEHSERMELSVSSDERHLQIRVLDQTVDVHLFGGTHGEFAYYEKMSSFVAERGLSVPQKPRETESDNLIALLVRAAVGSHSSPRELDPPRYEESKSQSPLESRLDEASQRFDYWLKNYNHYGEKTHAQELLYWIVADLGGKFISNFDEFIALAGKLDENGYEIKIMPSKDQFDEAMETYEKKVTKTRTSVSEKTRETESDMQVQALSASHSSPKELDPPRNEESKSLRPLESRLDKASQRFDYWLKNYNHYGEKTHAQELLYWIVSDLGGKFISNFDEFIALARKLDENGYEIKIMPSKDQFDEAMETYEKKVTKTRTSVSEKTRETESDMQVQALSASHSSPRELDPSRHEESKSLRPLEFRLDEASQRFDYWLKNYNHYGEKTHAQELLYWIGSDLGGKFISNFDEFIALAGKLDENGYEIKIMPSKDQFDEAMETYEKKVTKTRTSVSEKTRETESDSLVALLIQAVLGSHSSPKELDPPRQEESKSLRPLESRLDEASQRFDYWMKNYNHYGEETHAQELLDWIVADSGGELISNFDEFIALARKLDGNGYEIKIMPSKDQFDEAMETFVQSMI